MPLYPLNKIENGGKKANRDDREQLVDIVAVHGLDENLLDAWTDPETKTLWLRDLLPQTIQVARILTFGYDAYTSSFYGSGSVERIQQHAHTLIAALQADRSLNDCLERPIIFICHGLGGILVKKALAYSSTRTSKYVDHLHSIFISTYAILFFGTPHNGTNKVNWHHGSRLSSQTLEDSQLLSAVEKDSETLQTITDQFAPIMKQFHIFFFWEELRSKLPDGVGFIVEEHSAAPIVDNTERSGIHATHSQMICFSTTQCSSYRTVIEALVRYCRDAPPVIARRQKQAAEALAQTRSHEALELMGIAFDVHSGNQPFHFQLDAPEKARNKHFFLPQAVSSVFTGREGMSQLVERSLLAQGSGAPPRQQRRFIMYGIGGSGKTQFCCKFAQDHREKYNCSPSSSIRGPLKHYRFWGVFWLDATSAETAKGSLAKIGKLGELEGTADAGKHWLSHLKEPWLLIINNADDPSLDLESLFPEGEGGHILVTTRNPNFRVHGTVGSTEFKGLEEREALLLLLRSAAVPGPWDSSTEDTANRITSTLGYLALALVQAGAHILRGLCEMKDYLIFWNQYRKKPRRDASSRGVDSHEQYKVYSTWELSIDSLEQRHTEASKDAAQLLSIVAFFHFEHIPVDIFVKAINNKAKALESSRNVPFSSRFFQAIRSRLQPPSALPDFLRQDPAKLDACRVRQALSELQSFSLITYDGRDRCFSLHPVVHAWARDRLGSGGQALWAQIALNTLVESVLLPPDDSGEVHEDFRKDILPHLDTCIAACPIRILDYEAYFGGFKLPLGIIFHSMTLLNFREQVVRAARCGYVYAERGRFKDAAALLSMVKDALVKSRGYENELTMRAMLALAGTYWGLGRLQEAVELQKIVVDARTRVFNAEHHETLLAMDQLGRSYWLNGQYHEAIKLQTLTTERMRATLGPTHADTLAAMDNLGVTLGSWHRFPESVIAHRKVLDSRLKELGSSHLDTLTTMNNLAMALLDLEQTDEAQKLMFKVFEERKQKLGKEHPWTLWALCNLAKIQLERGALREAEEMLVPGIAAAKRSLSENHLGVLMGCGALARVFARQHRFEEAEELTRETIQRLEESRGLEHPDTVYALWKMAQLLELQNKLREAVETCELAVKRVNMRLTKQHPLGKKIDSYLSSLKNRLAAQSGD